MHDFNWHDGFTGGRFLWIEWHVWKVVGWMGNIVFTSRFLIQWYVTERRRQIVVPQVFWWLSLFGSLLLLTYWIHKGDSVGIFAYAFAWIPYLRSLMIHRQNKAARIACAGCGQKNPPQSNYCPNCGGKLN
jgi:lipid-A-disaccharide synthase-like uncharacterized protein